MTSDNTSTPSSDTNANSSQPMQESIISKKDKIAAAADEIISIDRKNLGKTLLELLKRMAGSEKSIVYWTCKKYLQDEYGLLMADSGHVGISDRYIPNLMYPGDVVVYTVVDMLKTGDFIQVLQLSDTKDLSIDHVMVNKVSLVDGAVQVEDLFSGSTYSVPKNNVIGKVVKVVNAFSKDWEETFYEFKDKRWLKKTLKKNIDIYKNMHYSNQRQILSEMEKRLARLKEDTR